MNDSVADVTTKLLGEEKIQAALRHVNSFFPYVERVDFTIEAHWNFCDAGAIRYPSFDSMDGTIDIDLLEDALDEVQEFPSTYYLIR